TCGPVAGPEAEVGRDRARGDDLSGVELPVGVPERLELAEALDELVAEHLREELRTRLAVAVLAGERASERQHEVGCVLQEGAPPRDPRRAREVEVPARVHAALPEVAVERAPVPVAAGEPLERAQVVAEPLWRHRGVLPALVAVRPARKERRRAETRLAHLPHVALARGVVVELRAAEAAARPLERGDHVVAARLRLRPRRAADLD